MVASAYLPNGIRAGLAGRAATILLVAGLVAGCSSVRGAPERLHSLAVETELAKSLAGPELLVEYAAAAGPRRKDLRDQIVLGRMYGIDLQFAEFEAQFTRERQGVEFLSSVANIGLTTSAATVAGKEAKTLLAAAAAALAGAKEAYDTDLLLDRTIPLLQQQMRTERTRVKVRILERLAFGSAEYPLELALADVEDYYRAGTLTGALIGATEESGIRLRQATIAADEVVGKRFVSTDLSARVRAFWRASPANRAAVAAWLRERGIRDPAYVFVNAGAAYAREQALLLRELAVRPAATPRISAAPAPAPVPLAPADPADLGRRIDAFAKASPENREKVLIAIGVAAPGVTYADFVRPGRLREQAAVIKALGIP